MVAGINHYGIFFKLWIEDSRSIGAAQGRMKRKLRNQILRTEVSIQVVKSLSNMEKEQGKPR